MIDLLGEHYKEVEITGRRQMRHEFARSGFGLFLLMTILNLAPLFYFQYIPSNDGPSHVYNSAMLRAFILSPSSPARTIFVLNSSIPPNLFTHSFIAVALSIFKPATAERLLVVLYAVLLPLGFRYFLRSISVLTHGLEYLSLVWVYNSHLHWGFYNFLLSVVLFLFSLGYWVRHRDQLSARTIAFLALLVTLLYFCHPVGLIEFSITSLAIIAFQWKSTRGFPRGLALFTSAATPAAVLYLHYALSRIAVVTPEITSWPTLRYSASLLFTFSPLASYWAIQRVIAASVLLILCSGFVCATQVRQLQHSINEYLVAACICAALVFIAPTSTGGGTMLTPRLVYFPIVLVCAWLASLDWKIDPRSWLAVLALMLAVAMQFSNWQPYTRYDAKMREFVASGPMWPNDQYLFFHATGGPATLVLDRRGAPYLSVTAAGYLAAGKGQVLLGDYQGMMNYFPLIYKKEIDPASYYASPQKKDACLAGEQFLDIRRYVSSTPLPVHSVAILSQNSNDADPACIGITPYARLQTRDFVLLQYHFEN